MENNPNQKANQGVENNPNQLDSEDGFESYLFVVIAFVQ
jgi:hypothetical protein